MATDFTHDVFLSHSAKDKAVVRDVADRLRADGLKVWFDEWVLKPEVPLAHRMGEGSGVRAAKIEEGLKHFKFGFRTSDFGFAQPAMSANAFGSDWAQLEAGTCGRGNLPFRDPLNQERRFIPLRLDDAPIKGSLAQFLYTNWRPAVREQEYAKLLDAFHLPPKASLESRCARSARSTKGNLTGASIELTSPQKFENTRHTRQLCEQRKNCAGK